MQLTTERGHTFLRVNFKRDGKSSTLNFNPTVLKKDQGFLENQLEEVLGRLDVTQSIDTCKQELKRLLGLEDISEKTGADLD